jgi:hypothetical protein
MRKRSVVGIAILACLLILTVAVPAHAAPRLRLYRGETSQGEHIKFIVAKTDAGRFVVELDIQDTLTCEDATTQDSGAGWGFASPRSAPPITERGVLVR